MSASGRETATRPVVDKLERATPAGTIGKQGGVRRRHERKRAGGEPKVFEDEESRAKPAANSTRGFHREPRPKNGLLVQIETPPKNGTHASKKISNPRGTSLLVSLGFEC